MAADGRVRNQLTDDQIVVKILAGERELFEVFVRRHSARLYHLALSITRNPSEAEDVVQETFGNAYRCLRQYAGRAAFFTWLARITTNISLQRLARSRRQLPFSGPDVDAVPPLHSSIPDPEQVLLARESRFLIRQAMDELAESQRSVLWLRDLREVDTAITARLLGITETNVKVRLHRARRALREKLSARFTTNASAQVPCRPAPLAASRVSSTLATRLPDRPR